MRARAAERPEDRAYTFLAEGEEEAGSLTYSELDSRARAVGACLQQLGLAGERALLLYPPGLDFVAAFLGCLYAGVVAVPAYPPRSARTLPRLAAIARDARPAAALTTSDLLETSRPLGNRMPELAAVRWLATDGLDAPGLAGEWREPAVHGDTLAFLQYTSGSTALPKGVMISHRNLLHNEEMIRAAFRQSESSVIVGWLPLYHDMGLIGNVLQPLYLGAPCVLMSPVAFLQRPLRWLRAISRYRATTSGGPNFAYDLCVKRISPAERQELDLSCWDLAFNGAEPVRPDTLARFAEAFGPSGFRSEAFYPCYGLAEATLFVAGGAAGEPAAVNGFRGEDLERGRVAPASSPAAGSRRLVGCGRAWDGQTIAIVNPETGLRCQADEVGEIWVAGSSVAAGYWDNPEESARTFQARIAGEDGEAFLRTGDLGFVSGGELYITGRLKDLIILRGRNLYPQDLELTAERSHPALRQGCGAAFSVDAGGEERLVLVYELERRREGEHEAAAEAIRRAVAEEHEAQVHEVVLARMGSVPKTSSGKIQRHACRAAYLAGDLEVVGRSALSLEEEAEAPATLDRSLLASLGPAGRRAALESWLAAEAGRALGLPAARIDPSRPLTALGLDSLGAVEIKSRAEETLGVEVSLGALLEGVSLAGLAADVLERLAEAPEQAPAAELVPLGEETGELPLSVGQRGLWYLHRLAPESLAYHLAGAGRVRGPLDTEALVRAFHALVERHPSLRTTFGETAGGPVQRVHAALPPEVLILDLAEGEDLEARLAAEVWRPFDLERGPLVRLGALRRGPAETVLFLAIHHIVSDFWSLAVMARDLGALYARETGRPAAAPPSLALRYTDWSRWREERLAGPEGERLWEGWREVLAGDPPRLELPTDRPWPAAQTWEGDARNFRLDGAVTGDLQALARRRGATLFMGLLAAFEALLARYTGQGEILLGSPTAGRSSGVADLVGYFVNPVAVRTRLADDPSFLDVLGETRRAVVAAFERQDYPFALLTERLQLRRDAARPPLFDVVFAFEKARGAEADLGGFALGEGGARLRLGGLELESLPLAPAGAPFALSLVLAETAGGIGAALRFNSGLFDAATMDRLAGHYQTLLAGGVTDPGRRLSEMPLLTAEEEWQLVAEWNETAGWYSREDPVHRLAAVWAEAAPDAPAVGPLSYGELVDRAGRVAGWLRRQGVGPEVRVPVVLDRSAELAVAVLAVLEAGGAYVPLDPANPAERLAWQLEDAWAGSPVRALLTRAELAESLGVQDARTLCVDRGLERLAPWGEPPLPVPAERAAYVIYTSGSTGRPKGVVISHGALANLVEWHCRTYGVSASDRAALVAGPGFDASVWEMWPYLAAGASLCIPIEEVRAAPARLVGWLAEEGVTVAFLPTPLAEAALAEAWPAETRLRALLTGGDRLRRGPRPGLPFVLHNHYGPTEGAVVATAAPVAPERTAPPIGRPIANARVHVLDRWQRLAPVGVPGELLLGGDGLARGYLHRPDLTAAAFVPDPFAEEAGCRLYRTGDLVRWTPEGSLEFLGRIDRQVKVRGFRVELGEIEAALAELPGVRQAVVVARSVRSDGSVGSDGSPGDRRLTAYVVGEAGAAELRESLRGRLPEAMIPAAWVFLETLPLTPNGKVDRKALPEPVAEVTGWIAPRTPAEEKLAAIWAEVLGMERVGVQDDFFALGGHSLLAVQLASRVREAFGVELPLRRLFEAPTVESLAAELAGTDAAVAPPLRPVDRSGDLPLSFAQERLWFLDQLAPGSAAYNLPVAVRLSGPLRPAALAAGLERIAARHEALRTRFESRAGRPAQVIESGTPLVLARVDLGGLPPERREAEALALCAREAARPFDLSRGPLLRPWLLRLEPEEWICLVVMHHIVADGWSLGVFLRELAAAYAALSQRSEPELPALPVQYADFAVWQRQWLRGETLRAEIAWWREQLAGAPPVLELPLDRPRPAAQSFRGARERLEIPAGLGRDLQRLAQSSGATAYMVLLAAFAALLGRLSGQEDVVVGSPVAGRTRGETERLIGFFVNTLALRVDLSRDPSFETLLSRVRERVLSALSHQDLPFEKLVEELAPERSLAHSPLVQVLLAVQTAPLEAGLPGLELRRLDVDPGISKLDLSLDLAPEADGGFSGWLEYDRDLFEAATARRLAGQLVGILEAVAGGPGPRLSELPLLNPEERRTLLADWSRTPGEYRTAGTVQDLFAEQALRTPDRPAVVSPREGLTFRELEDRSRRLAGRIHQPLAGLIADPGPGLAAGLLGILQSGAALVPLSPAQPDERIALVAADCGIEVLVTERRYLERARRLAPRVICIDDVEDTPPSPPVEAPPESLAYVIYTSGSTGKPKGVGVSHANLMPMLEWSRSYFGLDETRRVLQSLSYAFDFGLWEILTTLISGGAFFVPGPEDAGDPEAYGRLIREWGIDTLHATPSFFQAIAQSVEPGALDGLRTLHLGGEALSRGQVERFAEAVGAECRLYNGYGPTETTVNSLIFEIGTRGALRGGERVPVGRPSAYNTAYVLDRWGQPAPVGVSGELWVGGPGVARGYLDRPDLTAEKFVPDPFGGEPGARVYRTGDLVRWLASGDVEFLGRIDHQVKVRGFRIELGEVESVLRRHPGVREVVVTARPDRAGSLALVGYVLGDVPAEELRTFLRQRLPEAMVPAAFVTVDSLPLTSTGKVDRRALPEPQWGSPVAEGAQAPRTPVEEMVAGIWSELLGLERVGVETSFFELGGHSLLATRLMSRVRQSFGVELPLRRLFERSTVAALAVEIETLLRGDRQAGAPPLVRGAEREEYPLSFAQERLWFLDRLEPGSPLYNMPAAIRLAGAFDVSVFAAILGEIVRRHQALRTVFSEVASRPVQRIKPWTPFALPVVDLSDLPRERREAAAERLIREEARTAFDLSAGRLVRALLLRLGGEEHVLALTFHHIAADGWSIDVFLREVSALHAAFAAGRPSPLPELAIQYADFAVWQRQWLQGEALAEQLAYWRTALAGLPPALDLPTDRPRPAARGTRGAYLPLAIAGELAESVRSLARDQEATPFMVLLAGLQALLSRVSGQDDLAVGSVVANRNRLEIEPLIGFFVNTLVLRGELAGDPDFRGLLGRTRAAALGAYTHQDVPFEKLVEELAPQRDPSRTPLFQVALALQNAPAPPLELPGLKAEPLETDAGGSRFDLTLLLRDSADGFVGSVEYAVDLFDAGTVERLLGHYRTLLAGIVADPGRPVADLPLLSREEERQLLAESVRDAADWPDDVLLHEFFEAQAKRTPDAVALIGGTERLTYRELDERADHLARRLRALGVGPEVRVGVFLQRTPKLLISMLGILKAGGAYVPIDPAYPRERVEAILEDSRAPVVITDEMLLEEDGPELPELPVRMGRLAYVIYTSGSTGKPKGVAIEHGSVSALMHWSRETFSDEELKGVLASTSICFDMSVFELFAPLAWGGTVILAENALALPDLPARDEVTLIDTVP
ncbi:MAG TPA: amino acid adenylation domain-containing protein, partial [Thermoanaerobaculia bacterium]